MTTNATRRMTPAEEAAAEAAQRARVVAVLAEAFRAVKGYELDATTRLALTDRGADCAAVRPWNTVPAAYRIRRPSGSRLVMVPGGLVAWMGPKVWAAAEKEANEAKNNG